MQGIFLLADEPLRGMSIELVS